MLLLMIMMIMMMMMMIMMMMMTTMMMVVMMVVVVMVIAMVSCPKPMFAEDLLQRDRPSNLGRKSQLADRITMASNSIWIDRRGLYDDLGMAVLVSDHIPSLHNRNP
jgi:hypothetical protein